MKEFNVKVRTFRGYMIAPREKAIPRAKAMIREIIEDGFGEEQQFATFLHCDTNENLGMLKIEDGNLIGLDLDMRIATIKALLDK